MCFSPRENDTFPWRRPVFPEREARYYSRNAFSLGEEHKNASTKSLRLAPGAPRNPTRPQCLVSSWALLAAPLPGTNPAKLCIKPIEKATFPLRTPLFPSCCFTIETIDRKWAAPLELHSRPGAVRNRVAPGVPSGAPVARSDRQAETAGAVILCSSPWFYAHLLLPASRQAARALRRTNDLETCVAPIGSKMSRRSHWLKYTPKVFMPSAKALNLAGPHANLAEAGTSLRTNAPRTTLGF